jgi:hypothetical protein
MLVVDEAITMSFATSHAAGATSQSWAANRGGPSEERIPHTDIGADGPE